MFEHFTQEARAAVLAAVAAGRADGGVVRPEHLLAALCRDAGITALLEGIGFGADELATTLDEVAVARRRGGLSDVDARALQQFGIDLDVVVGQVERQLGPGALGTADGPRRFRRERFSDDAKHCLEEGVRQAKTRRDGSLGCLHLLLGVTIAGGVVADSLVAHGVTVATVLAQEGDARATG